MVKVMKLKKEFCFEFRAKQKGIEGKRKIFMYRKDSEKWLKHLDFIILDMICLQMAFVLAYVIRRRGLNIYGDVLYRNMAIFLGFADLVVIFMAGIMKSVLKRGYYKEFVTTLEQAVGVGALAIAYLFMIQESQSFSRMILITTVIIYLFFNYIIREIWKKYLHKKMKNGGDRKLLIVTSKEVAEQVVKNMQENNYARYSLAGVVVIDDDLTGKKICDVPVVANADDVSMYVCQEWIDEVLIVVSENLPYPEEIVDKLTETGVTVHLNLAKITNKTGKRQFVEKVGNYTVLTTSLNYASLGQLMLKRLMDICGGIVGCIATGIICLFVGPAIYIASPGPIFFSQERVGKNGKKFKIYKFRSMYMDAEERKAELMKENKLGDGKMFKMDFDPRVIGNKVLPDGTHKTGVGDFIRRTSLDEFPQFFNVLKGDMSIVGTRPPLISETNLYEPRHKVTEIEDAFYRNLSFGTGGLRGTIGAGTNRMNIYTVAKASQGLANYLLATYNEPSVSIGYDSRIKSDIFAQVAASVFVANGLRDKDAVNGACLICEMFSYYATNGITLIERLNQLFEKYGYCLNTLHSYEFDGVAGFSKMQNIMKVFHKEVGKNLKYDSFAGKKIEAVLDYSKGLNGLPKSDVLKYLLEENCSVVVRPSGTEPKLKTYISISAKSKEKAVEIEKKIKNQLDTFFK